MSNVGPESTVGRARKRRAARESALNKSGHAKRALYHCNYCQKDISNTPRIKCAVCPDFDLCLECFSVGVEITPHCNTHDYRVVDNLSFPIFAPDWGTDEELLLLEAVEMYGLGSWAAVADHMGPTKTAAQCKSHYYAVYVDVPTFPLPSPTPEMKLYELQKQAGVTSLDGIALADGSPMARKGRRGANTATTSDQHQPPSDQQAPEEEMKSPPDTDFVLYPPGSQPGDQQGATELTLPELKQQQERQRENQPDIVLFPHVKQDIPTPARVGAQSANQPTDLHGKGLDLQKAGAVLESESQGQGRMSMGIDGQQLPMLDLTKPVLDLADPPPEPDQDSEQQPSHDGVDKGSPMQIEGAQPPAAPTAQGPAAAAQPLDTTASQLASNDAPSEVPDAQPEAKHAAIQPSGMPNVQPEVKTEAAPVQPEVDAEEAEAIAAQPEVKAEDPVLLTAPPKLNSEATPLPDGPTTQPEVPAEHTLLLDSITVQSEVKTEQSSAQLAAQAEASIPLAAAIEEPQREAEATEPPVIVATQAEVETEEATAQQAAQTVSEQDVQANAGGTAIHLTGEQRLTAKAEKKLHRSHTMDEPTGPKAGAASTPHVLSGVRALHLEAPKPDVNGTATLPASQPPTPTDGTPLASAPGGARVGAANVFSGKAGAGVKASAATPGPTCNGLPKEPKLAQVQGDYAMGYNVKRNEFDPAYDEGAEHIIADMEFTELDTEEDRQLKLKMLEIYNKRLDERDTRKAFLRDYGLLSMRKVQALEQRRSGAERDTHARLRVFARYSSPHAHDDLVDGLLLEQRLRARIQELKDYRRMGVRTMEEAEIHESEMRRNKKQNTGTGTLFAPDGTLNVGTLAPGLTWDGTQLIFGNTGPTLSPGTGPGLLGPAQAAAVAAAAKDSGAASSATAPPPGGNKQAASSLETWRKHRGVPLDITCLPGTELLTSRERELCVSLRLLPAHYLALKDAMLRDCERNGPISRNEARTFFKLDPAKCLRLYDLWVACGWVSADKPAVASAPLKGSLSHSEERAMAWEAAPWHQLSNGGVPDVKSEGQNGMAHTQAMQWEGQNGAVAATMAAAMQDATQ